MTMISMEQEAVPAGLPTTYRQALGATRYRRAGTMTGWLNRKHRLFGRHFGSTGTGVVAATAWEAHVLAPFADPTIDSFARGGASRIPSF
jgi:hypothetical protein